MAHRLPYPPGVLASSLRGRRGAADRWDAWAATHRGDRPLVWAHAASVGEQQVLDPVLRRLVRARPGLQVIQTHTSPSVLRTAPPDAVCQRDYLPWDEPVPVGRALAALRPSLLVFGRGDLWPELVHQAVARGIPTAVVGATVRPGSARLHAGPRRALQPVHADLAWLGAASDADADRWARLGVPPNRIAVTGDPRHDRILERIMDLAPAAAVWSWADGAPLLIMGSVEPSDDAVLFEALTRLRSGEPEVRALLVPHDPSPRRCAALAGRGRQAGLELGRWSGPPAALPPARVVIVEAHGLLADLYLGATIAYVGGGFRRGHLHAVAEPAAVGVPVIVGPQWEGAPDADSMVTSGGALPLPKRQPGAVLAATVNRLVENGAERARRGLAARATLSAGAAGMSARALLAVLE